MSKPVVFSAAASPAATAVAASPVRYGVGSLSRWADFYELTKPRMNFLVVVTTLVGFYIAARGEIHWPLMIEALIGTALTAGAASALNQYLERQHDAMMTRTRRRPLPAGRVHPREALHFALSMGVVGVLYLAAFVNLLTAALGAMTLLLYVLVYTPMKRRSTLCTIVGAVPGAIPPMMGCTAHDNALSIEAMALFAILFVWQMPHFLAIAVLYRDDYAKAGFKMLPVVEPALRVTGHQTVLYTLVLIVVSLMPVHLRMAGTVYLVAALGLGLAFLAFAMLCAAHKTRASARGLFVASILYLPLLLAVLMVDAR